MILNLKVNRYIRIFHQKGKQNHSSRKQKSKKIFKNKVLTGGHRVIRVLGVPTVQVQPLAKGRQTAIGK